MRVQKIAQVGFDVSEEPRSHVRVLRNAHKSGMVAYPLPPMKQWPKIRDIVLTKSPRLDTEPVALKSAAFERITGRPWVGPRNDGSEPLVPASSEAR